MDTSKKNIALIISIILLFLTYVHTTAQENGNWAILNEGITTSPNAIDFISENIGWIASDNILLKTEDAGINWLPIPVEENFSLYRCDFINELSGWALARSSDLSKDIIIKTNNGGRNWSISKEMPDDYALTSIQVINDSTVYVIGYDPNIDFDRGFIWKSSDSGSTWIDISPNLSRKYPNAVWFVNSDTGILMCDRSIFRTSDGGISWKVDYLTQFKEIYDLQVNTDSKAFFLARKDYNDRQEYFLCASTDTFKTWMIKTQGTTRIQTYLAFDENLIFAVMQDSTGTRLMNSTNAGADWEKMCSLNDIPFYQHLYVNRTGLGILLSEFDFAIFSGNTAIWSSTDGGYSWRLAKFSYPLLDVFFIDQYIGFIAGGFRVFHGGTMGRLFKTEDGGETWNFMSELQDNFISSCQFIDNEVGFTVVRDWPSGIYKTNDGGESWYSIFETEKDSTLNDFNIDNAGFIDESVGWATGRFSTEDSSGAVILSTVDGGENWDIVFRHLDSETENFRFNSINVINSTVWAVGDNGLITKYRGNDQWQEITHLSDFPLNDVFFRDEQHGWISGGYSNSQDHYFQSILLKTMDAGETWSKKRDTKYLMNDMYFADSLHGWAVGTDSDRHGMILETMDGGDSWSVQVEGLSARLNAIHFKDGFGWAVGDNGLVLRTENGITWVDQNKNPTYPSKFSLLQNYPNPFNPKTIISWNIGVTRESPIHIDLSIYNVLGQKVTTLVTGKQKAGFHTVEWDAGGMASGVYYYRLQTEGFVETKKLVLLR